MEQITNWNDWAIKALNPKASGRLRHQRLRSAARAAVRRSGGRGQLRPVNEGDLEFDRDVVRQPSCSIRGAAVLSPFAECRNHDLGRAVKDARLVEGFATCRAGRIQR